MVTEEIAKCAGKFTVKHNTTKIVKSSPNIGSACHAAKLLVIYKLSTGAVLCLVWAPYLVFFFIFIVLFRCLCGFSVFFFSFFFFFFLGGGGVYNTKLFNNFNFH